MSLLQIKHLRFIFIFIGVYVLFVLRGLSTKHFQNLSLDFYFLETFEILIFLAPSGILVLKFTSKRKEYFKDSLWMAFYFTVPIAIADFIFLGVIKKFGISYFSKFWIITIYYPIFWITIPGTA